jgi:hypothetical protein
MQLAERMAHLNKLSTETRTPRAQLRKDIAALDVRDGRNRAALVLEDPPPFCSTMLVDQLLGSVRRLGPFKVQEMLRVAGISQRRRRRVGELTDHERAVLVELLRAR